MREKVLYAIGSDYRKSVVTTLISMIPLHLDASLEKTKDLDLVFWDSLSEGDQDAGLQSHLSMILNLETKGIVNRFSCIERDRTHANAGFCNTKYSIQLRPKAMILEATIVTAMNFSVSTVPHNRSK